MEERIDFRVFVALSASVVFAASAFAGIRAGLEGYSPEALALLRFLGASVILGIYALLTRMALPRWRDVPAIAVAGFLAFSVYSVALNRGELTVPAGTAGLLIGSIPAFAAIWATLFLRERLGVWGWVGIAVSFCGVALISVEDDTGIDSGALLVLLAALCASIYFVFQKPYVRRYGALAFTTYAIWAGTLFLLPFLPGLLVEAPRAALEPTLAVAYLGVVSTPLSYAFFLRRFADTGFQGLSHRVPGAGSSHLHRLDMARGDPGDPVVGRGRGSDRRSADGQLTRRPSRAENGEKNQRGGAL